LIAWGHLRSGQCIPVPIRRDAVQTVTAEEGFG
jgi:hypothetical protein